MNKIAISISSLLLLAFPFAASAHQHATFKIGGVTYDFVVGSLNEPIVVDDKTGVDFRVTMAGHEKMPANDHHAEGGAVTGLEQDLKVELIAGDAKKTLDLSPVYNTPGNYKAPFYPTVATELSYRFFGEIDGTPVDLTFTCREEGALAEEEGEKEISDGVKQISKTGGFGCPQEKVDQGFPEKASTLAGLRDAAGNATLVGFGSGVLALCAIGLALFRRRS